MDLSNNLLSKIQNGIFSGLLELKYLYLQNSARALDDQRALETRAQQRATAAAASVPVC
jgi:hypothetical protein